MNQPFTQFDRRGMVGIASPEFLDQRRAAVENGDYLPPEDDPTQWVTSPDELNQILNDPEHPRHRRIRSAAFQYVLPSKRRQMRFDPFHVVSSEHADRVHRLLIWLDELGKPWTQRRHAVRSLLQPTTGFTLNVVYIGKTTDAGRWNIAIGNPVGLASFDPWFQNEGLAPSVITLPGQPDTLDIDGVLIRSDRGSWRRRDVSALQVHEFFGIAPAFWDSLIDPKHYTVRKITPQHVRDRLARLTEKSHAPKVTGAAQQD